MRFSLLLVLSPSPKFLGLGFCLRVLVNVEFNTEFSILISYRVERAYVMSKVCVVCIISG